MIIRKPDEISKKEYDYFIHYISVNGLIYYKKDCWVIGNNDE